MFYTIRKYEKRGEIETYSLDFRRIESKHIDRLGRFLSYTPQYEKCYFIHRANEKLFVKRSLLEELLEVKNIIED